MIDTNTFTFSASSIKDYMQCGLKFKFSKIDKIEPTETATHHRWFGSLVHSMIYFNFADFDGSGKNLILRSSQRLDETLSTFEDVWDETPKTKEAEIITKSIGQKPIGKFAKGKIASLGSKEEDAEQVMLEEGWKEEAKKMILNGIEVLSNVHEIVELEKKIFYNVGKYSFIGFVDVVAKTPEGKYEFYDFKTSWDKSYDLKNDFQFFGYAKALSEDKKLGINSEYLPRGYWVHLRKGELLPYEIDKTKFWNMISMTKATISNIESNIFLADYGGPLCKFCDFRHVCYGSDDKIWTRGQK